MKILTLIPIYKRPEVVEICLQNLAKFKKQVPTWRLQVVCILSPEDKHLSENEKTVKKYGFKAVYYHNLPVSNKINAGIEYITAHYSFDYLMNFGSDDLIHPKIAELYQSYFDQGIKFFGINTLYFYEAATKKAIYFDTYNTNGSIGAGRMIHRSIIDQFKVDYLPLYEMGIDSGMDTNSAMNIKRSTDNVDVIVESGKFPYIVDIKTDTNINLFEHLATRTRNIQEVEPGYLNQFYENI